MGCVKTWGWWSEPAVATGEDAGPAVCAGGDARETASSSSFPSPPLPSPRPSYSYYTNASVLGRVPSQGCGRGEGVHPGSGTHLHTVVQAMMEEGRV